MSPFVRGVVFTVVAAFAVVGMLSLAGVDVSLNVSDPDGAAPTPTPDVADPTAAETDTPTPTPAGAVEQGYNLAKTERIFIDLLNEERRSRDLQPVTQRDVLTEMGRDHSRHMAENNYFSHDEPGPGGTIKDRYRERGLLPECELRAPGSDRYYPGAENIIRTAVNTDLVMDNGTMISVRSEGDLARAIFTSWMHSQGHREAMLVASADEAGLGLYITDDGEVYGSLELC